MKYKPEARIPSAPGTQGAETLEEKDLGEGRHPLRLGAGEGNRLQVETGTGRDLGAEAGTVRGELRAWTAWRWAPWGHTVWAPLLGGWREEREPGGCVGSHSGLAPGPRAGQGRASFSEQETQTWGLPEAFF